jgi:tetratricopeptide (TPR) repeat protein
MPRVATAPPPPDPHASARAAEAVRLHQEAAAAEAKRAQITKYMDAGRSALERQDWPAAANAYRIAASLEPEEPAVQATCNEALQKVAAALADGYWKQGLYEEGQDRWGEAALSFSKVCAGQPNNALAHDRVAHATLRSSTNYRRAVEFARKAIELDPKRAEYHITLARAYAAAGMEKSAASELERALELGPKDAKIINMVNAARAAVATATPQPPAVQASTPPPPSAAPASAAPGSTQTPAPPPPRKESGIHAFVSAVRSALAPKEGK